MLWRHRWPVDASTAGAGTTISEFTTNVFRDFEAIFARLTKTQPNAASFLKSPVSLFNKFNNSFNSILSFIYLAFSAVFVPILLVLLVVGLIVGYVFHRRRNNQ
jgi:hypothetical protein